MTRFGLALAAMLTMAAAPLAAGPSGLAFEPVAPEGLDATATKVVEKVQEGMPSQMPAFEQNGFGFYGALAAPVGVELQPERFAYWVGMSAKSENEEAAREAALADCRKKNGTDCTVIGLLVPATN